MAPLWQAEHSGGAVRYHYLHTDAVERPRLAIESGGDVSRQAVSTRFGQTQVLPGARIDMPLRFPGQYHDAETGHHYNKHHDYAPQLGRYLQSDPLGQYSY